MALNADVVQDFQKKLNTADDGDKKFTSDELAQFEQQLKEENFFENNNINEQAFNMQLHHYDNKSVNEAETGFSNVFSSGTNIFGDSLFDDSFEKQGNP